MDSTPSPSLSPRHPTPVNANTNNQVRQATPVPPDIGVRPVIMNQAAWRDVPLAAAALGNAAIVTGVLAAGLAGPDSSDPDSGDTALLHAAQHGQADMVQQLPDARATVDHTNRAGLTALGLAAIAGHGNVAATLGRNDAFRLFSHASSPLDTPEQLLRYNQAERALEVAYGKNARSTQPAFAALATAATTDGQASPGQWGRLQADTAYAQSGGIGRVQCRPTRHLTWSTPGISVAAQSTWRCTATLDTQAPGLVQARRTQATPAAPCDSG